MDYFTLDKIEFDAVRSILGRYCSCSLGRSLASRITPSRNPETVRRWLDQTTRMVLALRDHGVPPMAGVTDVTASLAEAHPGGAASGEDYAAIASTLEAVGFVRTYLLAMEESQPLVAEFAGGLGDFAREVEAIRAVVAPDGTVHDYASPRLQGIRREIDETSRRIHDVIYGYLRRPEVARLLQNANVTMHGDRFVLPVRAENRGRLPGVVHRASASGATVFVEPEASVELNNRLMDLNNDERLEVQRLLSELGVHVQARADDIRGALRTLAQVDLLSAKAQYSYQFEMAAPEVSEKRELELHQARHPLLVEQAWQQERAGLEKEKCHPVVGIDVRLGLDFDVLVITGSNTGGKTVALKTLALMCLMAQSGMHVPARRGARLPVFRDVFIDIGDEQSLQQSLSTFGGHIKRVRHILQKADASCLVLLDELGSGTDPDEGGAIGQAVLDELRQIGCLAMITTHLSVLKAYAFNHDRVDNASVEFDTATLSPTYHLRIGTPGESHAITVAQKLGMPRKLMALARRHLDEQGKQFAKAIRSTTTAREAAEAARKQAVESRLAAQSEQEMYQAKLADLHRLQEEFETWLASLPELAEGDEVFVPSLNRTGRLVRLELHRGLALVDAEQLQVEVPLKDLMPDLGQSEVRNQIADLRRRIMDQARAAEEAQEQARKLREEYHRSLELHKKRARQFDRWLSSISRVKVGDVVPISFRPGKGKLKSLDFTGLKAVVETDKEELSISIQDLFPQTGPFSHDPDRPAHAKPRRAPRPSRQRGQSGPPGEHPEGGQHDGGPERQGHGKHPRREDNRPVRHRAPESKAAQKNLEALLATQPGEMVFVIPFNKRATLIRVDRQKSQATVQSGIFEIEVPLADLEPVREESSPQ